MGRKTSQTIVLTLLFASAACLDDPQEPLVPDNPCNDLHQCDSGEICLEGACHRLCSTDRGCPNNDVCIGGLCHEGFCGDGIQAGNEECDLADSNSDSGLCLNNCTVNRCGDGYVHVGLEECDDGNRDDGDGCSSTCLLSSASSTSSESQTEISSEEPSSQDTNNEPANDGSNHEEANLDSQSCEDVTDCNGQCLADYHLSLVGDGFCDSDGDLINFNCEEFGFDNGDCDGSDSITTELDPSQSNLLTPVVEFSWEIVPDFYVDEVSWELYTYDGLFSLFLGNPSTASLTETIILEKGSYCFSVYDSYGDGGTSGQIWIDEQVWQTWSGSDYTSSYSTCFEVTFRDCPPGTTEDCRGQCVNDASLAYLGDGICDQGDRASINFNCAAFHWDYIDCL